MIVQVGHELLVDGDNNILMSDITYRGKQDLSKDFRIAVNPILYNRVSARKMMYWFIYNYRRSWRVWFGSRRDVDGALCYTYCFDFKKW